MCRYKSIALYAEVKLSQALDACTDVCPDVQQEDGTPAPNKLRAAVCMQARRMPYALANARQHVPCMESSCHPARNSCSCWESFHSCVDHSAKCC